MAYEPIRIELTPEDHRDVDDFCHGWKAREMSEHERAELCRAFLQYLKGKQWLREHEHDK